MAGLANFSWRDLERLFAKGGREAALRRRGGAPVQRAAVERVKIVRLNREVLDRHGAERKPIWLTELTWSSAKGHKQNLTQNWETTEAGQAAAPARGLRALRARPPSPAPGAHLLVHVGHVDRDSPNSFDYSGLRTQRPDGTVVDKPAARAFRAVVRRYR